MSAPTLAELVGAWDLGIQGELAASRTGYDVLEDRIGPMLATAASWCRAAGHRGVVQAAGRLVPLDRLSGEDAAGIGEGRHLRVVRLDGDGRPTENVVVRIWRTSDRALTTRSPLAPVARVLAGAPPAWTPASGPIDTQVTDPVDAVITWVDATDPGWRALIAPFGVAPDADQDRFGSQADELRYVLRSIDLFAPWFRRVHIFTNCAPPAWFRATDRIRWVDHAQVIPADGLPLFNSHAIEAYLHRIPDLAERFVYFNDDMMLWDSVDPATFFTAHGQSVAFLQEAGSMPYLFQMEQAGTATMWHRAMTNTARYVESRLGVLPTRLHEHVPYALRRSVLDALDVELADDLAAVRASRFRAATDLAIIPFVIQHLAVARGQAVRRDVAHVRFQHYNYRSARLRRTLRDSVFVCLNDGKGSSADAPYQAFKRELLERYLRLPSTAEAPGAPSVSAPGGTDPRQRSGKGRRSKERA